MVRVLLIDDDARLAELLRGYLEPQGIALVHAGGGQAGLGHLAGDAFDAVLLDVMMPGMDGLAVLRRLRADGHALPVIMLTARGEEADQVIGLEAGADDYVVKPFVPAVLLARLAALARRLGGRSDAVARWGPLAIDARAHQALAGDQPLTLTPTEFALLTQFVRQPGVVLTRKRPAPNASRMPLHVDPASSLVDAAS